MTPSVCFLGAGRMNARHIKFLRKLRPRVRVAVASRDPQRAEQFRRKHSLDDAFGDYTAAIESAFDAVVIGTPPSLHASLTRACLDAGKHLLIEKPVFQSLAQLRELWAPMRAHTNVVMVAENVHYDPFHRMIKARAASGDLGRPIYHDLDRVGRHAPTGWRADADEMPLGALHEGGVHWIRRILDVASAFESDDFGAVTGVVAFAGPPTTGTPGEDTSVVVARHRSGWTSRLVHSWAIRRTRFHTAKLIGERGAVYYSPRNIWGVERGARRRMLWPKLRDAEGFLAMWADFLACVDSGRSPELSLEHVWSDFAVMDAAYRSMTDQCETVPAPIPAG